MFREYADETPGARELNTPNPMSDTSDTNTDDELATTKIMSVLTEQEKTIIERTFQTFWSDSPVRNGMGVFLRMLIEYPEYKRLWPSFQHVHDSHLMGAAEIRAHTLAYMYGLLLGYCRHGLKLVIGVMNDDVLLTRQLKAVAKKHKDMGITKNHVLHMCPALLGAMKSCLEDDYNAKVEHAWTLLFDVVATLVEEYKFV